MEIATLSNLMSLASEVSGVDFNADDAKLSAENFEAIVDDIFAKISLLQKWSKEGRFYITSFSLYDNRLISFHPYHSKVQECPLHYQMA